MKFVWDDMIRIEPNQMILVNAFCRVETYQLAIPVFAYMSQTSHVALLCGISYMNF